MVLLRRIIFLMMVSLFVGVLVRVCLDGFFFGLGFLAIKEEVATIFKKVVF